MQVVYLGDDLGKHKAGSEENETEQRKATKRSPAMGSRGSIPQGPLRSMQNVPEMSTERHRLGVPCRGVRSPYTDNQPLWPSGCHVSGVESRKLRAVLKWLRNCSDVEAAGTPMRKLSNPSYRS